MNKMPQKNKPIVSIIMGSQSDYKTMKYTENVFKSLKIKFETNIVSAHRTPKRLFDFALGAERKNISVIIAGAGGSAHLPGMVAALSHIPVIGVPIESKKLKGLDSLLSIVQMPKGIPVGSVAIGKDGAINAALYAASILAISDKKIKLKLKQLRSRQTKLVKKKPK
tara:strand:+ start:21 stop:521 length:501 start_codon:yes stop_codon:yes gene_type:complete